MTIQRCLTAAFAALLLALPAFAADVGDIEKSAGKWESSCGGQGCLMSRIIGGGTSDLDAVLAEVAVASGSDKVTFITFIVEATGVDIAKGFTVAFGKYTPEGASFRVDTVPGSERTLRFDSCNDQVCELTVKGGVIPADAGGPAVDLRDQLFKQTLLVVGVTKSERLRTRSTALSAFVRDYNQMLTKRGKAP